MRSSVVLDGSGVGAFAGESFDHLALNRWLETRGCKKRRAHTTHTRTTTITIRAAQSGGSTESERWFQTANTIPTALLSWFSLSTPKIKRPHPHHLRLCLLPTARRQPRLRPASKLACELSTRFLRRGVQRLSLPTNFINDALVHRVVVLQRIEEEVRVGGTLTTNGPSDVHLAFAATKHATK